MPQITDWRGIVIQPGDTIVYAAGAGSRSPRIVHAVVEFVDNEGYFSLENYYDRDSARPIKARAVSDSLFGRSTKSLVHLKANGSVTVISGFPSTADGL